MMTDENQECRYGDVIVFLTLENILPYKLDGYMQNGQTLGCRVLAGEEIS